jgi:hypothetical protein
MEIPEEARKNIVGALQTAAVWGVGISIALLSNTILSKLLPTASAKQELEIVRELQDKAGDTSLFDVLTDLAVRQGASGISLWHVTITSSSRLPSPAGFYVVRKAQRR